MIAKICRICGREFQVYLSRSHVKYCSAECRSQARAKAATGRTKEKRQHHPKVSRICQQCGKVFLASEDMVRLGKLGILIWLAMVALLPGKDLAAAGGQVEFIVGQKQYFTNGQVNNVDVAPFIENSRTYVPVRYLAEALGASVNWEGATRTVTLTKEKVEVKLVVGNNVITVNGKGRPMDVAPLIRNGRTFLPARYVAEAFGYQVSWDPRARSVLLGAFEEESLGTANKARTLVSFIAKEGDDRTITIDCPKCGMSFNHDYTSDQKYICPKCGDVIETKTIIALNKEGLVFVPLRTFTCELQPYGLKVEHKQTVEQVPILGSPLARRTITNIYYFHNNKGSIRWSEANSNYIEVDGEMRELAGIPFKEKAEYVAYYADRPEYRRYKTEGANTVTFVPLKDFAEPLGYKVERHGNTVIIAK